jgi:hypothetical protein
VPISNEDRLVVPDTLGTTIKLTSSASWRADHLAPADYSQRVRCCHLFIGPAVVTCPEIRSPPGFWFSGPAPCRYSQPRAGRSATECERGRGLSALAGTPNADYLLRRRLSGRSQARSRCPVLSPPVDTGWARASRGRWQGPVAVLRPALTSAASLVRGLSQDAGGWCRQGTPRSTR